MTEFIGTDENDLANAATPVLNGFAGGNVGQLTDTSGDFFAGAGGEDIIFAGDAADKIEGGEGHDLLNGGAGDDIIYGNTESDPLGSVIGDQIVGNDGNDLLRGSNGDDSIDGGSDDDNIDGGGGNDFLQGGFGNDSLFGGEGDDTIYAESFNHGLESNENSLLGANGNDALTGAAGNDLLGGGAGADTLHGANGDDSFIIHPGDVAPGEIIDGGSHSDTLEVYGSVNFTSAASIEGIEHITLHPYIFGGGTAVTFTANQVNTAFPAIHGEVFADTFRIEMGSETSFTVPNLNFVDWNAAEDRIELVGDADDEIIIGTLHVDRLFGNGGNDTLAGAGGVDQLFGGFGNDVYQVDQASGEPIEAANQGNDSVLTFLSYTLAANLENLTLLGTGNRNATGNTLANTIVGNSGDNILNGAAGIDSLQGLGGNDSYFVDSAADRIFETTGTDNVNASVSYTLAAGVAVETLRTTNAAGTAAINLTGNNLANLVIGNAGANNLNGGGGPDTMQGLAGNDIYVVDNVSDKAIEAASAGMDRVNSAVSFTLGANLENLTLTGAAAVNGTGNTLANILIGNSGNNLLNGLAGADSMRGGLGNDSYIVDHVSDQVVESAGAGTDSIASSVTEVLALNIENLTLTGAAAVNGTGNTLANILIGNSGNNLLNGLAGADSMRGGLGNDSYFVDSAADRIFETTGTDNVNASVSYTLAAGVAVETLRTTNAAGTAAINLTGNNLANLVIGNAGANNLNGGGGPDTMQGLAGNDIYVVDNVSDKAIEAASAGMDRVNSAVSFTLGANLENLTLTGSAAVNGTGNTLANILIGNSGNNLLNGLAGADSMRGGLGNDSYIVDHVSDQVVESAGAGTDSIASSVTEVLALNIENLTLTGAAAINGTGNTLNNAITGNAANNILTGSSGNDSLNGSTGNDFLIGGGNKDTMTGGVGADDFDFNDLAEMGKTAATRDVITDFTVGDDIDLSTIDANGLAVGNTAFSFLAANDAAFTGAEGQLRWQKFSSLTLVEGDINGDRLADFQLQLTGSKNLTAADFIL